MCYYNKITAMPSGITKRLPGQLEYVTFTASNATQCKMWTVDHGSLVDLFSSVVTREEAMKIDRDLRRGVTITLRGHYAPVQLCLLGFRELREDDKG